MSAEARNSSALFKRAEQLRRWEESETNRESLVPHKKTKRIQFSSGCVFLAACAAGEKDEVLRLIEKGADIDTANIDGLTALHQACIDDHLEMVEFLVENEADVNRGDNEGWTPLHATASCGFVSIARYLLENGANVAAVNNDGDLPVDIAESEEMEHVLQRCIVDQGIDADEARNEEERLMLRDAKEWQTNGRGSEPAAHPVTGATALHVAAAKGYTKVMRVLLQCMADVNAQDKDGWTPLHAAAHWGQVEACEMLVYNNCNMDLQNYVGQTVFDVADSEMIRTLEELRKERGEIIVTKNLNTPKRRSPPQRIDKLPLNNREIEEPHINDDISNKIKNESQEARQSVGSGGDLDVESSKRVSSPESSESSETSTESDSESASDAVEEDSQQARATELEAEKKNRVNEATRIPSSPSEVKKSVPNMVTPSPTKAPPSEPADDTLSSDTSAWRRSGSLRTRTANRLEDTSVPANSLRIVEKDSNTLAVTSSNVPTDSLENQEVVLRRTRSFECDEKFFRRYKELHDRINAGSCPTLNSQATPNIRSASLREKYLNRVREEPAAPNKPASPVAAPPAASPMRSGAGAGSTPSTPTSPGGSKLSPSNIFKQFFKSIVPPVRDEESETQRKAHAKRVRETRRSTQGVTLEEIKSAEQLVKKKNAAAAAAAVSTTTTAPGNSSAEQASLPNPSPILPSTPATSAVAMSAETTSGESATSISAAAATATSSSPGNHERRPSWRLRVDNGDRSKFLLEDARRTGDQAASATVTYTRRTSASGTPPTVRPNSTPVEPPTTTTTVSGATDTSVTVSLRRNSSKNLDDKDQDKENDSRGAQATQAVIQRRRRPKRRSTGVVHLDMDEIDPDRQDASKDEPSNESDWSGRSSRVNSSVGAGGDNSLGSTRATTPVTTKEDRDSTENGEPDYKRLYEESQLENERLREKLKKTEGELTESKSQIEKTSQSRASKMSLSEMEKRERRSLERKLAEMEEELKILDQIRTENQRLKDENGALIRVISKLSK